MRRDQQLHGNLQQALASVRRKVPGAPREKRHTVLIANLALKWFDELLLPQLCKEAGLKLRRARRPAVETSLKALWNLAYFYAASAVRRHVEKAKPRLSEMTDHHHMVYGAYAGGIVIHDKTFERTLSDYGLEEEVLRLRKRPMPSVSRSLLEPREFIALVSRLTTP